MATITNPSAEAAFKDAMASHRAGQLAAAERAYRAVIDAAPGHPMANHNLGVLMVQSGRAKDGLRYIKAAINANPQEALFYFSMAKGLLTAGDPATASVVLSDAGQLGLIDHRFAGLKTEVRQAAVDLFRRAVAANPRDAVAMAHLGDALLDQGEGMVWELEGNDVTEGSGNTSDVLFDGRASAGGFEYEGRFWLTFQKRQSQTVWVYAKTKIYLGDTRPSVKFKEFRDVTRE